MRCAGGAGEVRVVLITRCPPSNFQDELLRTCEKLLLASPLEYFWSLSSSLARIRDTEIQLLILMLMWKAL